MSDEDVNIERNKHTLERLRREDNGKPREPDRTSGRGDVSGREGVNSQDKGVNPGLDGRVETREKRAGAIDATPERLREGVRPANRPGVNATKGTDSDSRGPETIEGPQFRLRNVFKREKTPTKLFSKTEAEAVIDKLADVYFHGSSLLDDILEIIVRDHEPVEIWQLAEEEASTLAEMHLTRAQYDEEAARSARKMLQIYDRIYFYLLVWPRAKLTATHIKEHKGFSFK